MNLKQAVYRSPFAKMAKDLEAQIHYFGLRNQSGQWKGAKTVYCLSPYKSGTTFLASSFDSSVSSHEPMQYLSLKLFEKDFDRYFIPRLNKLNLKLECSPYFSAYIDELANHEVGRELTYLCILREPTSWVSSVVNFYNRPYARAMTFEYENELFWKRKVGVDVRNIFRPDGEIKEEELQKIIEFYFRFTENTLQLSNVHYVRLKDMKRALPAIGKLIGAEPDFSKSWKRETKPEEKIFRYTNEDLDKKYDLLTSRFTTLGESPLALVN